MTHRILMPRALVTAILLAALPLQPAAADQPAATDGVTVPLRMEANPKHPRYGEGDFVALKDGRILFVYTRYIDGWHDESFADVVSRSSNDGGKTWTTEEEMVAPATKKLAYRTISLLRLASGKIALVSLAYPGDSRRSDNRPTIRFSTDEAKTWSAPVPVIPGNPQGYTIVHNGRLVQLASGRIIVPLANHYDPAWKEVRQRGEIACYLSDDDGKTFRCSRTVHGKKTPDGPKTFLQEPGVVALKDGRLMMWMRTDAGSQFLSYSSDDGETWTEPAPSKIISPLLPASAAIKRIPSTGDLLLVWNNHEGVPDERRAFRTPFNVAISRDDGQTWEHKQTLEDDPKGTYCCTAIAFAGDHVLLGHTATHRRPEPEMPATLRTPMWDCQITRFPVSWLYR